MDGFTVSRANKFLEGGQLSTSESKGDLSTVEDMSSLPKTNGTGSFADTLQTAIGSVNELQKTSDKSMQNLATGRTDNIADVMMAAEKADIALRLMVQVRNKIIDAYQEVMKMQV